MDIVCARLAVTLRHLAASRGAHLLNTGIGSARTISFTNAAAMSSVKFAFSSKNKAGECPAVKAGDESKSKMGLIVLQEWWGLNDQIQREAEEIGMMGNFVTIVPDLYRGKLTKDFEEAGHYMGSLDWPGAVDDIQGAAQKLKEMGCKKVGVTGFCMGGALSLAAAVRVPEVDAAAPFYGIPGDDLADVTKIKIPLQCHFAAKDHVVGFSCPKSQTTLREKLDKGGVKYDFHTYDAGHAFTNPTAENYDKACCDLALKRMVDFMTQHLS